MKYIIIIIYGIWFYQRKNKARMERRKIKLAFSIWLRQMEVLLAYNTVSVAIDKSIEEAPTNLKPYLSQLNQQIKTNPQLEDSYTNFLKELEDIKIERTMHHLYRYALLGTADVENQLTRIIEENAEELRKHRKAIFESQLSFYSVYGLIPMILMSLIVLGILFIVLTYLMKGGWQA